MFNYPVHQAADILFCHGNLVPGGRDQLPHVEITRKIARTFNKTYSPRRRYFQEPVLLFGEAPMLLGTDGKKMGKSARNAVFIRDDEATTAAVLKKAVTDSDPHIAYDPVNRPTVANLLLLGALAAGTTPEAVADEIGRGRLGAAQGVRDRGGQRALPADPGPPGRARGRSGDRQERARAGQRDRPADRAQDAARGARAHASLMGTRSDLGTTLGL